MVKARSGPTMEHRLLAGRLRRLRERAGCSLQDAARALGVHTMTIRRIEAAETRLDAGHIGVLLDRYGAPPPVVEQVFSDLARAARPGWWQPYRAVLDDAAQAWIGVETAAELIRGWHPAFVPDLLRTPAYDAALRAVLRPGEPVGEREARAALLAERQRRLAARGARLWVLLAEGALRTVVGDAAVMREQLDVLERVARLPGCTVQVARAAGPPHPLSAAPPLHLLRLPHPEIGDHAVVHLPAGLTQHTEDPRQVAELRLALDAACAAAPHPDAPLPDVTLPDAPSPVASGGSDR